MYHPRAKVTIWYEDLYGRKWEYNMRWNEFKAHAIEILEEHILDINIQLYYTIENTTYELDYFNTRF